MQRRSERGFALIFVLWVTALIAMVAAGLVTKVRTSALVSSNMDRSSRAEAVADGITRLLALRLSEGRNLSRDGTPGVCDYDGTRVEYAVQDQAGLIDINTAPDFLLAELFARLGRDANSARRLAEDIFDFRDADQTARRGGSEPQRYGGAGFGPKNAPFEAVEELDQVPGMVALQQDSLADLVTVNSFEAGIDPDAAPAALRTLFEQPPSGEFNGMLAAFVSRSQKRAFGLDVRVTMDDGGRFRRRSLAYMTRDPEQPFRFLEWQRGRDWTESRQQAIASCFTL